MKDATANAYKALVKYLSAGSYPDAEKTEAARENLIVAADMLELEGSNPELLGHVRELLDLGIGLGRVGREGLTTPGVPYHFPEDVVEWLLKRAQNAHPFYDDYDGGPLGEISMIRLLSGEHLDSIHRGCAADFDLVMGQLAGVYAGMTEIYEESPSDDVGDLDYRYLDIGDGGSAEKTVVIDGSDPQFPPQPPPQPRLSTYGDELAKWEEALNDVGWQRSEGGWERDVPPEENPDRKALKAKLMR